MLSTRVRSGSLAVLWDGFLSGSGAATAPLSVLCSLGLMVSQTDRSPHIHACSASLPSDQIRPIIVSVMSCSVLDLTHVLSCPVLDLSSCPVRLSGPV